MTQKHHEGPTLHDPLNVVWRRATASRRIEQSPLSDDPPVPRGTAGYVQDWDSLDELYAVDFGKPYGVVLCCVDEIF